MGFKSWFRRWKLRYISSKPIQLVRKRAAKWNFELEELEHRVVPAAISWTGSAGTLNWGTAGNWSTNTVPTSSDNVTINLAGVGTINIASGNYSVATLNDTTAALSIASGGTLSFAS